MESKNKPESLEEIENPFEEENAFDVEEYEGKVEDSEDSSLQQSITGESYVVGDDVVYSTPQVVKILNEQIPGEKELNTDMVRYYAREFMDCLDIAKTSSGKSGHWRFHSKDIERLKVIISLRRDEGKSVEEVKRIIRDDMMYEIYLHNEKFMQIIMDVVKGNNQILMKNFSQLLNQVLLEQNEASMKLLEEKDLKEKKYQETIAELQTEVKELRDLIEERLPEKPEKKGFFGIFKK